MRARRSSVTLSTTYKGRRRPAPVWVMRYRLPSGKDSKKVIGLAWRKKGRPPQGFLTEADAVLEAEAFAAEHSADARDARRRFRAALDAFLSHCTHEKGLRGSTLHEYRKIGERLPRRPWRGELTWADRALDTFTRRRPAGRPSGARRRKAERQHGEPLPPCRARRLRDAPSSPALAWAWMGQKVESEGKLQFYTPEQVRRLIAAAYSPLDAALYTLATEAGPA